MYSSLFKRVASDRLSSRVRAFESSDGDDIPVHIDRRKPNDLADDEAISGSDGENMRSISSTRQVEAPSQGPNEEVSTITCRIAFFDKTGQRGVMTSNSNWEDATIQLPFSMSIPDLEQAVLRQAESELAKDPEFMSTTVECETILEFDTKIVMHDPKEDQVELRVSRRAFESIADFFEDPKARNVGVQVNVRVFIESAKSTEHRKKLKEFNPDQLVFRRGVKKRRPRRNFRVGIRPPPPAQEEQIPITDTLVAHYKETDGRQHDSGDVRLELVRAWDFGDYCIGDPSRGEDPTSKGVQAEYRDLFFPQYDGFDSIEDLHARLQQHLNSGAAEPGSGVPFMPTYTFNLFEKTQDSGLNDMSDVVVNAVVRFRDPSQLDAGYAGDTICAPRPNPGAKVDESWLPIDFQMEFEGRDTAATITSHLEDQLLGWAKRSNPETARHQAYSKVFERDDNGELVRHPGWVIHLWVLPQGGKKMYRFLRQTRGRQSELRSVLDQRRINENRHGKGRALYTEAFIEPVQRPDEVA